MPPDEQQRYTTREKLTKQYFKTSQLNEGSSAVIEIGNSSNTEASIANLLAHSINQSNLSEKAIQLINCLDTLKCNQSISHVVHNLSGETPPSEPVAWLTWVFRQMQHVTKPATALMISVKHGLKKPSQLIDLIYLIKEVNQSDINHIIELGHHLIHYQHILFAERDAEDCLSALLLASINPSIIDNLTLLWSLNAAVYYDHSEKNLLLIEKTQQLGLLLKSLAVSSLEDRKPSIKQQMIDYYQDRLPESIKHQPLHAGIARRLALLLEFDIYSSKQINSIDLPLEWLNNTPSNQSSNTSLSLSRCITTVFCCARHQPLQSLNTNFTFLPRLLQALKTFHDACKQPLSAKEMIEWMLWLETCVEKKLQDNSTSLSLCGFAILFETATGVLKAKQPLDENSQYLYALHPKYTLPHGKGYFALIRTGSFSNLMPTKYLRDTCDRSMELIFTKALMTL